MTTRILSATKEVGNFFPLLILITFLFCCLEIFRLIQLSSQDKLMLFFLSQFLFLNIQHVGLSFALFFGVDKIQSDITNFKNLSPKSYFLGFIIALLSASLFLLAYLSKDVISGVKPSTLLFYQILVIGILTTTHRIKQSFGILNYRNMRIRPSEEFYFYSKKKFNLFTTLTTFIICLSIFRHFHKNFYNTELFYTSISLTIFQSILLLQLFLKQNQEYKNGENHNFFFRFIFWILAPYSFIAFTFTACLHGLEYYSIYKKLNQSEYKIKKVWITYFCVVGVSVFGLGRTVMTHEILPGIVPTFMALLLGFLSIFVSVLHFHFDKIIFSLKNKKTKEILLS